MSDWQEIVVCGECLKLKKDEREKCFHVGSDNSQFKVAMFTTKHSEYNHEKKISLQKGFFDELNGASTYNDYLIELKNEYDKMILNSKINEIYTLIPLIIFNQ